MTGLEQARGVCAGGIAVSGDHHPLAGGQTVVLDHPGREPAPGAEAVEGGVEVGGVVDDLAGRRPHAGSRHDVFGERLRPLDAGGLFGRAEAGDSGRAYCVGNPEHQRHLGSDDDQIGADPGGQRGDVLAGRHVDLVLVGHGRGPGIAGRDRHRVDLRVSAQRKQQRMFTGSGSDYQDVHRSPP